MCTGRCRSGRCEILQFEIFKSFYYTPREFRNKLIDCFDYQFPSRLFLSLLYFVLIICIFVF